MQNALHMSLDRYSGRNIARATICPDFTTACPSCPPACGAQSHAGEVMVPKFSPSTSVGAKAFIIGAIVLALLIPLAMLRGLISERAGLREGAYAKVAQGWGGDLVVGGPILQIPTQRLVTDG